METLKEDFEVTRKYNIVSWLEKAEQSALKTQHLLPAWKHVLFISVRLLQSKEKKWRSTTILADSKCITLIIVQSPHAFWLMCLPYPCPSLSFHFRLFLLVCFVWGFFVYFCLFVWFGFVSLVGFFGGGREVVVFFCLKEIKLIWLCVFHVTTKSSGPQAPH